MSAITIRPTGGSAVPHSNRDLRPRLGRLIAVELRKMLNTRAGFWLPICVAGITLLAAILSSSNHGGRNGTFAHVLHSSSLPSAYLLPVMGVLLVCSEWSQRTTLTTFTLVPSRWRVIAAKLGASAIVSTVALVVCLLLTAVCATAFGHAPGGTGSLSWQLIGQSWLFLVSGMVMGLAFGAAILLSAPAIVIYLLLPVVWNAIVTNISALDGVARWLSASDTLSPLTEHTLSGTEWAHALVTFAFWIGIPILVGLARIGRGDLD
ncbi:MAG: ABC transporter permease [Acidobacteriota bacterium]|nr:ABC transporter permease [Acidobacteriota bacterium]